MKHDEAAWAYARVSTREGEPFELSSNASGSEPQIKAGLAMHKRWTQAQINDLRLRLSAGASVAQIATATDRTLASVSVIMGQLRLRAAPNS